MLTRTLSRLVMGAALLCGTLAWTGWAYLNTAAAPHRFEDVAVAVFADPEARAEIAVPLADQIVGKTGVDPAYTPQIRAAVADAMADPRVSANVTAAFGSVHARAVGVDDPRPATIDGAALTEAVRTHLATADPALATLLPPGAIGDLSLPEYHPPFVSSLRTVAVACTTWFALIAIALLAVALIVGDRKYVMRRFGVWAIVTGAVWALGPRILIAVVRRMVPDADATLTAAIVAATRTVSTVATVLVVLGVASIAAAQLVGRRFVPAPVGGPMVERRPVRRAAAAPVPGRRPASPPVTRPEHIDTWTPSPRPVPTASTHPTTVATVVARPAQPPSAPTAAGGPPPRPPAPEIVIRPAGWGVTQFTSPDSLFGPPSRVAVGPDVQPAGDDDAVDPWAYFTKPPESTSGDVEG